MASVVTSHDPKLVATIEAVVDLLRPMAEYRIEPRLLERMHELGGNKERCSERDREEYDAWVEFWKHRTLDKLKALHALQLLRDMFPEQEFFSDLDSLLSLEEQP